MPDVAGLSRPRWRGFKVDGYGACERRVGPWERLGPGKRQVSVARRRLAMSPDTPRRRCAPLMAPGGAQFPLGAISRALESGDCD